MNEKRAKKLLQCIASNNTVELAIGFIRYEALRKLSPKEYGEICLHNLSGTLFDDLVDELAGKD